ncbi:MAG TPA: ABC transporter ATP-binding protein [Thermoanaerobaculia bacterium]|nr:ABC transporter ATP-binding protein [Thermoanaerobaculia bacterium]
MSSLLSVRSLKVELPIGGNLFPAVDGIDFDLESGEALGMVGESGSGKTLAARALLDLLPEGARLSGDIRYRGRKLAGLPEREWRKIRGREIAMVFQEPASALDPVQTIGSQIVEAIRAHGGVDHSAALAQARRLLEEVSFGDPDRGLSEFPHRLSGGLRQRACLAIALAARPSVLIADEPTTALDATLAADALDLLDRLRRDRGLAVLLITHDLAAVAHRTDRCLVVYAGRVVEESGTGDLFQRPLHPYTRGLLASAGALGGELRPIAGAIPDLAFRPRGRCAFAPRCPERFDPCERGEPGLIGDGGARARCFLLESAEPGSPTAQIRGSGR